MDISPEPATTDGAIKLASQYFSILAYVGKTPLLKKTRERGGYVHKYRFDRSGPSWPSSIAVSLNARPAA